MSAPVKVGDVLFISGRNQWSPMPVTVATVARKWATFPGRRGVARFDAATLELDTRGYYGRLYRSEEDWQAEYDKRRRQVEAQRAWDSLMQAIRSHYVGAGKISAAAIHQAAELLGFTITPEPPK